MAISSGQLININDIINGFMNNVYNPIIANCYDNTYIPSDLHYPMIDSSILGNIEVSKAAITNYLNSIGGSGSTVNAVNIAQFMSLALQVLRKVGTWSYARRYDDNGTYVTKYSSSGKAIFSDEYTSNYIGAFGDNQLLIGTVPGPGIQSNEMVTASQITNYYTILLQKWNNIIKPRASKTVYTCHTNCHTNCHDNCHSNNSCYK